jgi:uncharacterized protein
VLAHHSLVSFALYALQTNDGEILMLQRMTLAFLCVFISDDVTHAASFDCTEASSVMEKTICADNLLSKVDEEMGSYYFKLKDSLNGERSQELLREQRSWLKLRASKCAVNDSSCLKKLYNDRIHVLRIRYENLVPYVFPDSGALQGLRGTCGFAELKLPE